MLQDVKLGHFFQHLTPKGFGICFCCVLFLLLSSQISFSQNHPSSACDTLVLKSGQTVLVNILEVDYEGVYYQKCGDSRERIFLVKKENILEIKSASKKTFSFYEEDNENYKEDNEKWAIEISLYSLLGVSAQVYPHQGLENAGINLFADMRFPFPNEKINIGISGGVGSYLSPFTTFDDGMLIRLGPKLFVAGENRTWTADLQYFVYGPGDEYNPTTEFIGGLIGIGVQSNKRKHFFIYSKVNLLIGEGWGSEFYTFMEMMFGLGWRF